MNKKYRVRGNGVAQKPRENKLRHVQRSSRIAHAGGVISNQAHQMPGLNT